MTRQHRLEAGHMVAARYAVTCSCGMRVETHTAATLVWWLVQHRQGRR